MNEIEQEIASAKESLEEMRLNHRCEQESSQASLEQSRNKLQILQETFHRRLHKSNTCDLSYYCSVMRQVHTWKSLPDSITLRKQATMLSASHRIEVLRKAMELLQKQTDSLAQYMRCEIAVMEWEHDDIKADFMEHKRLERVAWERIEAPLRHRVRVQENAMNHILSLLELQQEIRSHSLSSSQHFSLEGESSTKSFSNSFATHDLHQSLSVVSSTFVDSFSKLPEGNGEEPMNMVELMKQLLILDGTFPTEPDDDDLLENSCRDWTRLEQLLSSH
ncbi:hypothetical protein MHU86_6839 [Fragilaria crotonensis]|nr:hypothetical protein MHU86_6839 [Fragilaria crotonensis]